MFRKAQFNDENVFKTAVKLLHDMKEISKGLTGGYPAFPPALDNPYGLSTTSNFGLQQPAEAVDRNFSKIDYMLDFIFDLERCFNPFTLAEFNIAMNAYCEAKQREWSGYSNCYGTAQSHIDRRKAAHERYEPIIVQLKEKSITYLTLLLKLKTRLNHISEECIAELFKPLGHTVDAVVEVPSLKRMLLQQTFADTFESGFANMHLNVLKALDKNMELIEEERQRRMDIESLPFQRNGR